MRSEKPKGMTDRMWNALTREYPPATPKPCSDCPWRRNAKPEWLGPYTAGEWLEIVHGESPISCHQTITEVNEEGVGDWDHPAMRQCRGAAIFRANVVKSPKNPNIVTGPEDHEHVFSTNAEFAAYHGGIEDFTDPIGVSRRRLAERRQEEEA